MPQLAPYVLITCETGLSAPQVKFSVPIGTTSFLAWANGAANAIKGLLTLATEIPKWSAHNLGGQTLDEGALNLTGTVDDDFTDTTYALFLRLNTAVRTLRPSTQYVMAYPVTFIANGDLTTGGAAAFSTYAAALVTLGVTDSEGHTVTGATFQHFSRRQNIAMVV